MEPSKDLRNLSLKPQVFSSFSIKMLIILSLIIQLINTLPTLPKKLSFVDWERKIHKAIVGRVPAIKNSKIRSLVKYTGNAEKIIPATAPYLFAGSSLAATGVGLAMAVDHIQHIPKREPRDSRNDQAIPADKDPFAKD